VGAVTPLAKRSFRQVDPVASEYLHLVRTDEEWKIINALWHLT
jgi:hypothetical protein